MLTLTFILTVAAQALVTHAQSLSHGDMRADELYPTEDSYDTDYDQNFEWSYDPVDNENFDTDPEVPFYNDEIYVPEWEDWIIDYGRDLVYQQQSERYFYKQLNEDMYSMMYELEDSLTNKAMMMAHKAEWRIRVDLKRRERDSRKLMKMVEESTPSRSRGNTVNLDIAKQYSAMEKIAMDKFKFHSAEADKLTALFDGELQVAMDDGMNLARWHRIVGLRSQLIAHTSEKVNQRYYQSVYHAHYLLYKYGTQNGSHQIPMSQYLFWFLLIFFILNAIFDSCMWFFCFFLPHSFAFIVGRLSTRASFFLYV